MIVLNDAVRFFIRARVNADGGPLRLGKNSFGAFTGTPIISVSSSTETGSAGDNTSTGLGGSSLKFRVPGTRNTRAASKTDGSTIRLCVSQSSFMRNARGHHRSLSMVSVKGQYTWMPRPELTSTGLGKPIVLQKRRSSRSPVSWSMYPSILPLALGTPLVGPQSMSSQTALKYLALSALRFSPVPNLAQPKYTSRSPSK